MNGLRPRRSHQDFGANGPQEGLEADVADRYVGGVVGRAEQDGLGAASDGCDGAQRLGGDDHQGLDQCRRQGNLRGGPPDHVLSPSAVADRVDEGVRAAKAAMAG